MKLGQHEQHPGLECEEFIMSWSQMKVSHSCSAFNLTATHIQPLVTVSRPTLENADRLCSRDSCPNAKSFKLIQNAAASQGLISLALEWDWVDQFFPGYNTDYWSCTPSCLIRNVRLHRGGFIAKVLWDATYRLSKVNLFIAVLLLFFSDAYNMQICKWFLKLYTDYSK